MNSKPIWQMSAADTAAKIRAKELSAVDAVGAAIDRMGAVNDSVNAVTLSLADAAMAAAEHADTLVANGSPLGPLHGVPVTIKENIDQEGIANTNGLPAFAEQIAPADSPVSRNLKNSGAIVIGRTNTPEFSYRWFTDNPLRGRTLNPWHHGHTQPSASQILGASVDQVRFLRRWRMQAAIGRPPSSRPRIRGSHHISPRKRPTTVTTIPASRMKTPTIAARPRKISNATDVR